MTGLVLEEAIKMLKAKLECMTRDVSGTNDDCNRKLCGECHLNYEQGNMGQQKEYLRMAIEALEKEPILDKIRYEIETERNAGCHTQYAGGLDFALSVIDKYRAEIEDEE